MGIIKDQTNILKKNLSNFNMSEENKTTFPFQYGSIEINSNKILFISNADSSLTAIQKNNFDGIHFQKQKRLIHDDINYVFRYALLGVLFLVLSFIIFAILPEGNFRDQSMMIFILIACIPIYFGGFILIAMVINAFIGINLYSRLLIKVAGKYIGVVTIMSKQSTENITLYTMQAEESKADNLINHLSNYQN